MTRERWRVIYDMGKFDHCCYESEYKPLCDAYVQINARFYDKELIVVPFSHMREMIENRVDMFVCGGSCVKQVD